jgi:hypothetical protein
LGLAVIGKEAFKWTPSLRTFDFGCLKPGAVIRCDAFRKSGLVSVVLSRNTALVLDVRAFYHCEFLREVALYRTNTTSGLFCHCSSLERVSLTAPVPVIDLSAFTACSALRSLDLCTLSADAEIKAYAFVGSSLLEVTLPPKLRSIGDSAFQACQSLVSVRLPRELGHLGKNVFGVCSSLERLEWGDIREIDGSPAMLVTHTEVTRLELTGKNFDSIPGQAIASWLAAKASVISRRFAGRQLGRFRIVSD